MKMFFPSIEFQFQNCDLSLIRRIFSFETTDDLERMPNEMIGQHRAVRAMEFGLSVEQSGYNLFVVGPTGTGRMTYTQDSVEKVAKEVALFPMIGAMSIILTIRIVHW